MTKAKKIKGLLIDLDGTVYRGKSSIKGAKAFIEKLITSQTPFLFLTNNSMRSHQEVQAFLEKEHQILVDPERVYSSVDALVYALKGAYHQVDHQQAAYIIGSEILKKSVSDLGFEVRTNIDQQIDLVVVGLNQSVFYDQIAQAAIAVQRGADFYLTNPDIQFPDERGFVPGAGSLGRMISEVSRTRPLVCGKPEKLIMSGALAKLGLQANEVAMLGDNLTTDILAANRMDMPAILIETGVHHKEDLEHFSGQPDYIVKDYEELGKLWQEISDFT
ncbi:MULTISPECIES: HAD-IIA family hydrolase [Aerococcus]|uniref:HAD-IIA family hydrolase n=1 Tax=Aerococcus TaxID=1375 RepID=UPI0018A7BDA5|nr:MULTISPECIES: HAD-IIA family hydrolase [Aerococcus]MCY3035700.1 HAD-IIA family hydrolase [Aerococcus sp. Group 2]MCY3039834.1 HAD-IIA family hydrolase [Aerococcus sp. Group 2]MCY3040368.1 HAD-IIA family hydrolase [Aerococcus sp. Group 2]MCY3043292.1 HAD-IIA family hydrolase [Aerococcus sp. Group 2]MDK6519812.1 HAD-IIA family hydrolase [Aerococcus urinae]